MKRRALTAAELQRYFPGGVPKRARSGSVPAVGRSRKGWVEVGGQRFYARSAWEGNYGRYLQWQQEQGLIAGWKHEPETFWFPGIKRGVCSYLPDFAVTPLGGPVEYHEVKGYLDARSRTKLKRMAKYYPQVPVVLIDRARYRALARTVAGLVPGWGKAVENVELGILNAELKDGAARVGGTPGGRSLPRRTGK